MTTATRSRPTAGDTSTIADLLTRANDHDPTAWEEIVHRYNNLVSATVRSFRLQDADAHDAIQTTWLRLTENTRRVLRPERLGSWLATIARHECLRILRHTKKPTQELTETLADTLPDPAPGPEQHALEADTARTLWNLVEELSPRQQTLLRALFTDHPRPYAEVTQAAGIPPGAIGPTRARALRQLRDRLNETRAARAA